MAPARAALAPNTPPDLAGGLDGADWAPLRLATLLRLLRLRTPQSTPHITEHRRRGRSTPPDAPSHRYGAANSEAHVQRRRHGSSHAARSPLSPTPPTPQTFAIR